MDAADAGAVLSVVAGPVDCGVVSCVEGVAAPLACTDVDVVVTAGGLNVASGSVVEDSRPAADTGVPPDFAAVCGSTLTAETGIAVECTVASVTGVLLSGATATGGAAEVAPAAGAVEAGTPKTE
jgi:hypothetical protein